MIKIALCDDEREQLDLMEQIIGKSLLQIGMEHVFAKFISGEELLMASDIKDFYAVFLDIDMPEISGIDVARKLPDLNEHIQIVFVSNHEDMVFEAIHVRPVRFIRKRFMREELREAVDFLVKEFERAAGTLIFGSGRAMVEVKSSDIIYIETTGHYLRIILTSGERKVRGKISDYLPELKNYYFLQVQKGIVVNMFKIVLIKGDKVFLSNDVNFTISRGIKDEVKREFLKFMRKEI